MHLHYVYGLVCDVHIYIYMYVYIYTFIQDFGVWNCELQVHSSLVEPQTFYHWLHGVQQAHCYTGAKAGFTSSK